MNEFRINNQFTSSTDLPSRMTKIKTASNDRRLDYNTSVQYKRRLNMLAPIWSNLASPKNLSNITAEHTTGFKGSRKPDRRKTCTLFSKVTKICLKQQDYRNTLLYIRRLYIYYIETMANTACTK